MQENEVIQQVIDTIRRDLVRNKDFLKSVLEGMQLTMENFPPELILSIMSQANNTQQVPKPLKNAPKDISKGKSAVARPIAVGVKESMIISDLLEGNNVYLQGKAGTGKAQPLSAKILCENGWKTFADIKVGDKVFGDDGKLYAVDAVYDRGVKPVYRVIFNDSAEAETCDEHLWKIQTRNDRNQKREGSVKSLKEFMHNLTSGADKRANAYIPINKAIEFAEQKHVVDPYLMGVILGDGGITTTTPTITNPSQELFDNLILPEGMELSDRTYDKDCFTYSIKQTQKHNSKSILTLELEASGLMYKKSIEKFIPLNYLHDSIENRIALLQGLNDTDGCPSDTHFEYSTSSERLSNDYAELVRSLGGTARISSRVPNYTYNGEKKKGVLTYRIHCVFPENIIPFRVSEKLSRYHNPEKYFPKRYIESVEFKGEEPVRCISVTNPTHLYITDGYAVTHNTYLAEAIADSVMGQKKFMINCSQWTSPVEIRGGQTITGYVEGQLTKAWAEGGMLILDELPKLDPNTAGLLNDALSKSSHRPKYDENGKVIQSTVPSIVNGRGHVIYKGQDQPDEEMKYRFCVIATGNTNMMDVGNRYGGNQRQDYSLVDRFAGSFYTIESDPVKEMELTYPYVFNVCNAMRKFLLERDAMQSISLRTMLSFNRTFEQEMLYKIPSEKFCDEIIANDGNQVPPKTIENSIESFLSMMESEMRKDLEKFPEFREARNAEPDVDDFVLHFKKKYHLDPKTGDELTDAEIAEINKK